jgi:hypothetical protein
MKSKGNYHFWHEVVHASWPLESHTMVIFYMQLQILLQRTLLFLSQGSVGLQCCCFQPIKMHGVTREDSEQISALMTSNVIEFNINVLIERFSKNSYTFITCMYLR